jgi:hypothetical protein
MDPVNLTSVSNTIQVRRSGEHIQLYCEPDTTAIIPTLVIPTVDNSGSMGAASTDKQGTDAAHFSRSDLVRHSVATIVELLSHPHSLAVVLFDDNASRALEPTADRAAGRAILPSIQPGGGTNIWAGLIKSLQIAEGTDPNQNVAIVLQTDGESDPSLNPPRGIPDTLRTWLDTHPDVARRVTIHTIGFGYGRALDMPLLRQIAAIGRGTVNYIPDGTMVGTVLIHLLASVMSCQARGVRVNVPSMGASHWVGFLQGGQVRDLVIPGLRDEDEVFVSAEGVTVTVTVTNSGTPDPADTAFALARNLFMEGVSRAMDLASSGKTPTAILDDLYAALTQMAMASANHSNHFTADVRILALMNDLRHVDSHKGQIEKALSDGAQFERWGRHYVPAVLDGHRNQWPINFKDEGSAIYGGSITRDLVNRGDAIFVTLPAPTRSSSATTPATMSGTHSAVGPCFLPESLVLMADGTRRACSDLRRGDAVRGGHRIVCVVKTYVPYADIVRLWNCSSPNPPGGFTMWHPVFYEGTWTHPANIGRIERVYTDAIYNFVLDGGHTLDINGITTCTLGHDFVGPVIGHPYFGRREAGQRHILDDLAAQPGWDSGFVTWSNLSVSHDPNTGFINGFSTNIDTYTIDDIHEVSFDEIA